jgi:thiol-disulfide isomerase/thioredoxin
MRKFLLFLSALSLTAVSNSQTILSENFNATTGSSLPAGWTQVGTGNGAGWITGTPAQINSSSFGIPASTDGRALGINDDASQGNAYSNRLVVTPEVDLTATDESALYLKLDLLFPGGTYQGNTETLKIEASTDQGATWTVLENVAGYLDFNWHVKTMSLGAYAGEESFMLGFRYGDGSGWLYGAAIDNFTIINLAAHDAVLSSVAPQLGQTESYGAVGATKSITGSVTNFGSNAITSYTIKYQQGSGDIQTYTKTVNIAAMGSDNFVHSVPYTIGAVGEFPIDVWVEIADDVDASNDSLSAFVQGVEFMPVKRILFEEGTGTWCGWCPRGTVAMDEFAEEHPGAAAQVAVHNGDPMTVSSYDNFIGNMIGGYPSMVVDRSFEADPGDILDIYEELQNSFGFANITLGEISFTGNTAALPVTITPAVTINNAKITLIVTESNLSGTGSGWNQTNYYSGGGEGPMGGFENKPANVPNTKFHFVARSTTPSPAGTATVVPAVMNAGETYTIDLSTNLNSSWVPENLQYIVVLLANDGTVLNTNMSATPQLDPIFASVENVEAGVLKLELYPNPARDIVNLSYNMVETVEAEIRITDMNGRVIQSMNKVLVSGSNKIQMSTSELANGLYNITTNTAKGITSLRLIIER